MRKTALSAFAAALVGAGSFALVALGSGSGRPVDVAAANARTAHADSVHYSFIVRVTKERQPMILHIDGGSSRDAVAVHLRLDDLSSNMPGTTGAVLLSTPFLYEQAPGGIAVFGNVRWLRLQVSHLSPRSQTLSTVRSLTPSPLLHVIAEAKLHPGAAAGTFAGKVAYDDPIVRTALTSLTGGIEFRNLHVSVSVGADGLIHHVRITGRTADHGTHFSLAARLYAFGAPIEVVPPKPGTFLDRQLAEIAA